VDLIQIVIYEGAAESRPVKHIRSYRLGNHSMSDPGQLSVFLIGSRVEFLQVLMISKVIFSGRAAAEVCGPFHDWALISIGEPDASNGPPNLKEGWFEVLRLAFHDVDTDRFDVPGGTFHLMSEADARQIIDFVERVAPHIDVLFVHCSAGISRSAAVAKWVARRYGLRFDVEYRNYNHLVFRLLDEAEHS
jgi:hypothetical protein